MYVDIYTCIHVCTIRIQSSRVCHTHIYIHTYVLTFQYGLLYMHVRLWLQARIQRGKSPNVSHTYLYLSHTYITHTHIYMYHKLYTYIYVYIYIYVSHTYEHTHTHIYIYHIHMKVYLKKIIMSFVMHSNGAHISCQMLFYIFLEDDHVKSSKMAHFVFKCNKEDYLFLKLIMSVVILSRHGDGHLQILINGFLLVSHASECSPIHTYTHTHTCLHTFVCSTKRETLLLRSSQS
jgi:hypothetical protein